ncbi:MAG: glycosyltransferase [Patescibacteria group bacterium]|nr:glycosyltransferase [Patescibacteria group bacterium]
MKLAAITRADFSGLATLSRVFTSFLGIHRTLALSYRPDRADASWLDPAATRFVRSNQITAADAEWLLDGADCVLSHETWYGPEVSLLARKRGIKTALTIMFEMLPMGGIANGFTELAICPHELALREAEITPCLAGALKVCLPFPIDTEEIPFRRRELARTFVHFAKEGVRDGTPDVLAAWPLVKSDARLIVYQHGEPPLAGDDRVEVRQRSRDAYADYAAGDVLLLPHRWSGYGCVLHEALAAGMPTMVTAWWPFCDFAGFPRATGSVDERLAARYESDAPGLLPGAIQSLSLPTTTARRVDLSRSIISFETTAEVIAARVDALYDSDISDVSEEARAWAEERSFDKLRATWIAALST